MGRDLHFSLDNLPARYRIQAAQKLADDAANKTMQATRPKPANCGSRSFNDNRKHKRFVAPVRMKKSASGMTDTEERFNRELLLGGGKFEALTLNLPGDTKYTPDFLFEDDGNVFLIEVKGAYKLPTHGRSVMAFKIACSLFPMFTFMFAEKGSKGGTWRIGTYKNGVEVNAVEGTAEELHNLK